jgi:hypothetical protein
MNLRKSIVLILIGIIIFGLSVITVSAKDDRIIKPDLYIEKTEGEGSLTKTPSLYIELEREKGEGGEEEIIPYIDMDNKQKNNEDEHRDSLAILGNKATKDGSNNFANILKIPVLIFLAIVGLLTLIVVYASRKK